MSNPFIRALECWLVLLPLSLVAQSNVVDQSFNPGSGPNDEVLAVALAPDGKPVLGGFFSAVNGTLRNRIARLQTNGALDLVFSNSCDNSVLALAIHTNGDVLLGGRFSFVGATARNQLARLLTATGALDAGFVPPPLTNQFGSVGRVESVAVQSDGKVLFGGDFATVNGTNRNSIARLNTNGTLETSFNPGSGPGGTGFTPINAIALDPNQRVIVGGEFTSFNGTNRPGLARLNTNGALDASFAPALRSDSAVACFAVQGDGKVVIAGSLITPGGVTLANPQRLLTNGTLDGTFNPGSGAGSGGITRIALAPNGQIVINGGFATFNGTNRSSLARLNTNGGLDVLFGASNGVPTADTIAVQSDGKVIIGGNFTSVAGVGRTNVARFNGGAPGVLQWSLSTTSVVESAGSVALAVLRTGGSGGTVTVDFTTTNGTALAGADFAGAVGTLSFADGETNKSVVITLTDDAGYEDPETFSVLLRNPTGGASIGPQTNVTVTILDDLPPPSTVQFESASYAFFENAGRAQLRVLRSGSTNTVTVSFSTLNGTASAGSDYLATNGVLTFGPTDTAQTINVPILDTYAVEGDESFTVQLSNPTGAALGGVSNATATILDTSFSYEDLYGHRLLIVSNVAVYDLDTSGRFTNRLTLQNPSQTQSSNGYVQLTGLDTNSGSYVTNRFFFTTIPAGAMTNVIVGGPSIVVFGTNPPVTNYVYATAYEQLGATNAAQDSRQIMAVVGGNGPPSGGVPVGGGGLPAPGFIPPPMITNLLVTGPAFVDENSAADFFAVAMLDNGTNNTNVSASWASSAFGISPSGRLNAGDVVGDLSVLLTAGVTNGTNVVMGTNTTTVVDLRALTLQLQPFTNAQVSLLLRGTTGRSYVLDATTNLVNSNSWSPLATNQILSNSLRAVSDPGATNLPLRFYRARQAP